MADLVLFRSFSFSSSAIFFCISSMAFCIFCMFALSWSSSGLCAHAVRPPAADSARTSDIVFVMLDFIMGVFMLFVACELLLLRGTKNIEVELLGDVTDRLLRAHAVAEIIKRRGEAHNRHLAGYDGHDAAAHAGLGRQTRVP